MRGSAKLSRNMEGFAYREVLDVEIHCAQGGTSLSWASIPLAQVGVGIFVLGMKV